MQEIREGKEGYGDPSGEATEEARPRISRQTAWSARSAAQGALRWHHTARGLCSSWRRITEKRAGSPRARTCPETEAADGHGYRALLWPATLNLVACLYMGGCFQTDAAAGRAVTRDQVVASSSGEVNDKVGERGRQAAATRARESPLCPPGLRCQSDGSGPARRPL